MNMAIHATAVAELLQQKIDLFAEYERITNTMLECPIEEMLGCVGARQDLAHKIDAVDIELSGHYASEKGEALRAVVLNAVEWGLCPEELRDVFLLGQQLSAYFTRIAEKEEQTISYVEAKKEELLELIKKQNSGVTAKTAKYYGTVRQSEDNFSFFDQKY